MAELRTSTPQPIRKGQPVRGMARESDMLTPFWQAITWGLMATLVLEAIAYVYMDAGPGVKPRILLYLGILVFPIVSIYAWYRAQNIARDTLYAWEMYRREDIDGDGYQGPPPAKPDVRLLEVYSAPPQNPKPPDPAGAETRRRLAEFVRGCEKDTTQRYWEPKVGRTQWEEWRGLLLRLGYAVENRPGQSNSPWQLRYSAQDTIRLLFGLPRPSGIDEG